MTLRIFDIKRFAVHDGDGIRTTVFFKGCPLRCLWCHNPEGLSVEPATAYYPHKCIGCGECAKADFTPESCLGEAYTVYGRDISSDELLPILLEDREFYLSSGGGVTLSGGECLLQSEGCAELLSLLKSEGIATAVDTCGFVPREALERVIPYTDLFLYDLKALDPELHKKCTGASNEPILSNLRYLDSLGARLEIRIPFVPEYNAEEIPSLAKLISTLSSVKRIRLLAYHNLAGSKYGALNMKNSMPHRLPTEAELKEARKILETVTGLSVTD